jgi:DNA-binding XRE family transcriptional regulator
MLRTSPKEKASLLVRGQHALGMTQETLGQALGASRRTVSRWTALRSSLTDTTMAKLARLVHSRDAALAAEVARALGETLETLGIVTPAPPAPPPPPARATPTPPSGHLGSAIVCAAAEAMDLSPRTLRPALFAAFKCARELGLSVEAVEGLLAPARGKAKGSE